MTERFRLTIAVTKTTVRQVLMLGSTIQGEARKQGGEARVFRAADAVLFDVDGISQADLDSLVSSLAEETVQDKDDLKIVRSVRRTDFPPTVIRGEFLREKLTKKLLLELPHGAWLVSNTFPRTGPWTAQISEHTDRQRVWEQAANHGAAQRLVAVVWSKEDADSFSTWGAP
jgi:hypothetical protein